MDEIAVYFIKIYSYAPERLAYRESSIKCHINSFSMGEFYVKRLLLNIKIVKAENSYHIYELMENDTIQVIEKKTGIINRFENNLQFILLSQAKVCVFKPILKQKLFGLDEVEHQIINILNSSHTNELICLYGLNGCGKRSLLKNLEFEIENKIFYWFDNNEMKSNIQYIHELSNVIEISSGETVLCVINPDQLVKDQLEILHCELQKLLDSEKINIKIVISLQNLESINPHISQLSTRNIFVRNLSIGEKSEFIQSLICRNEPKQELETLSKSLQGFTAADIVRFMEKIRLIDRDLSLNSMMECSKNYDYIPEHLSKFKSEIKSIRWNDIGGYESVKRILHEEIEIPLKLGKMPIKGVLFHGPAGCSKTMFVQALATECDMKLFSISPMTVMRSIVGESEQVLSEIINLAVASSPSIIFIDEIDMLMSQREEREISVTDRLLNQLMTFLNGIQSDNSYQVLFVAATNCRELLDKALIRPGRIDLEVKIDLPDQQARESILKIVFSDPKFEIDKNLMNAIPMFAKQFQNKPGVDIVFFGENVKRKSLKEFNANNKGSNNKPIIKIDHTNQMLFN